MVPSCAKEGFRWRKRQTAYIHSAFACRRWCGMHSPQGPPASSLSPANQPPAGPAQQLINASVAKDVQQNEVNPTRVPSGTNPPAGSDTQKMKRAASGGGKEFAAIVMVSWKAFGCISVSWNATSALATSCMCFLLADRHARCSWIWPPFWMHNRAASGIYSPKKNNTIVLMYYAEIWSFIIHLVNIALLRAHKSLPTRDERGCHKNMTGNTGVALVSSHYRLHFGVPVSLSPTSPRLFLFPFNLFQLRGAIAFLSGTALWGTRHQHCGGGRNSTQIKNGKKWISVITILLATQQNTRRLFSVLCSQ